MIGICVQERSDNFVENMASNLLFAAVFALSSLPSCTNLPGQNMEHMINL